MFPERSPLVVKERQPIAIKITRSWENEKAPLTFWTAKQPIVLRDMPDDWGGKQRTVARGKMRQFNEKIAEEDRLPIVDRSLVIIED